MLIRVDMFFFFNRRLRHFNYLFSYWKIFLYNYNFLLREWRGMVLSIVYFFLSAGRGWVWLESSHSVCHSWFLLLVLHIITNCGWRFNSIFWYEDCLWWVPTFNCSLQFTYAQRCWNSLRCYDSSPKYTRNC